MPQIIPRNPFYALLFGLVIVFLVVGLIGWEGEPGVLTETAAEAPASKPDKAAAAAPAAPASQPAEAEAEVTEFASDDELVETADGEETAGISADPGADEAPADPGGDGGDGGDEPVDRRGGDGSEPMVH